LPIPLRKIKPSLFPAIAWFAISVILLILPGTAFPTEDWLDKIWFDKWVHIGMFAILVTLFCWAMLRKKEPSIALKNTFIIIGISGFAYGIGMEFVQKYFIPYRSFDVGDIIADGIGSTAGVIYSLGRYIKK
jgi:multisubunit Na+/H+ antiporter MnhB subunit